MDRLAVRVPRRRGRLHCGTERFLALRCQLVTIHVSGGPPAVDLVGSRTITTLVLPADNGIGSRERNKFALIGRVYGRFAPRYLRRCRIQLGLQLRNARAQRVDVRFELEDAFDAGQVDALVLAESLDLTKQRDIAR